MLSGQSYQVGIKLKLKQQAIIVHRFRQFVCKMKHLQCAFSLVLAVLILITI